MQITNRKGRARKLVPAFSVAFATASLLALAGGKASTATTSTAQNAVAACNGDEGLQPKLTNNQINIRDTFVLAYDCKYYLYGTRGASAFSPTMDGYDVYVSTDLANWDGPHEVYHTTPSNWATRRYWAPEVHVIDGTFYMFMAWASSTSRQTPTILSARNPLGPFSLHGGPFFMGSEGNDLTIWEEDGQTNVVLNFESPGTGTPINANGIYYAPINQALTGFTNVPKLMFTSAGCGWCTQQPARFHDGAWLHKLSDGTLISLFSQQSAQGYAIGVVESSNGRLDGTWTHHPELLVTGGGHGMLFRSLGGKLMLATHKDVAQRVTNPFFYEMEEDLANKTLRIVKAARSGS